jgi:putative FmdB family regulatory protein
MPVYEFECDKGTVTEKIVPMGTRQIRCPCCHKKAKKILSRCTFELKGSGWYADGYASKKPPAAS